MNVKGLTSSFLAHLDIFILVSFAACFYLSIIVLSHVPWGKYCALDGSHFCDKEVLENVCKEMYERT